MADWSQLPNELLFLITKFVKTSSDLTRFRSVCSTWRSSVPPKPGARFPFPTTYSLVTKRTIFLIGLPETSGRWLVKIEEDEHERIHLLDSLSNSRFKPPFYFTKVLNLLNFRVFELGHEYVHQWRTTNVPYEDALQGKFLSDLCTKKVAFMSLNSGGDDYMLLVAKTWGQLAIYKSRDKDWTMIEDMSACYDDVIQFKGKFYVADRKGSTVIVEPSSNMSLLAHKGYRSDKKFFIESGGELLLVDMVLLAKLGLKPDFLAERFFVSSSKEQNKMVWFRVFKLDEEQQKWDQVKCLEDRVLFLGDYSAFSVPASEFPGGKGNQIFFWEDCFISCEQNDGVSKDRDILVFNLENGSVKPFINCPSYSKLFWPPTDWVFT